MSKFYKITVKDIQRQTKDAVVITLDIPKNLEKEFVYEPGQYITFKVNIANQELNRSYSLCSSTSCNEAPMVAVKEVKGGRVSTYLNKKLKIGDTLEAMPPMGNFKATIDTKDKIHYIFYGGGSGITPLFSIIKTALFKAKSTQLTLFYANYNSQSVIFKNELEALAKEHPERFTLVHVFDKPEKKGGFLGFNKKIIEELPFVQGPISQKLSIQLLKDYTKMDFSNAQFYMCGPTGLMDNVSHALSSLQIPKEKVHREYFTEKTESEKEALNVGEIDENFKGTADIELIYDGKTFNLKAKHNETILDAALEADVDPPFACMVGACTTCRAKLNTGSAKMKDSQALSPKEIEAGYILTCQALPRSKTLKINFDE